MTTKNSIADAERVMLSPAFAEVNRAAAAMNKNELLDEIPAEDVPLPSRGLLYPPSDPLHGQETVAINPMSTPQEDILTSTVLHKRGTVIDELIKSCLVDKTIDVANLMSGDKLALMVGVRISGYGSDYRPTLKCDSCNETHERHFDLSKLGIKYLELQPVRPGANEFPFTLPVSKKQVTFRFPTSRDNDELAKAEANRKKLNLGTEQIVSSKLLQSIVSVSGVTDRAKISEWIAKAIRPQDSLALRMFMTDNEPGVDMKQTTECPACGHTEEVSMPIDVTFLWPHARR